MNNNSRIRSTRERTQMRKMIIAATVTAAAATLAVASIATATSTTKTETFTAMTTNPGSGVASLIATGGFTAGGTMTNGKHKLTFRFAGGKFTLVIGRPGSKHVSLNPTTCLYTKTGSGTYTLTDGTGAYQGISGSGKISFTLRAVYALVNGKCPSNDQPGGSGTWTAIQFTETASGPVSLP
jgi:expansin (peptidoglycan-binding protein)